ncbi:MAG: hypothetical protein WCB44_18290 [Stellaceae bacterium]
MPYYFAGVRSMMGGWHNFFYNEQSTATLMGFKAKNSAARRPAPVPKRRCTSV